MDVAFWGVGCKSTVGNGVACGPHEVPWVVNNGKVGGKELLAMKQGPVELLRRTNIELLLSKAEVSDDDNELNEKNDMAR